MSLLTKISIVVLVVLNIIASMAFITLATVGENYRQKLDTEQLSRKQAVQKAQEETLAHSKAVAELEKIAGDNQSLQQQLAVLKQTSDQQIRDLNNSLGDEKSTTALLKAELAKLATVVQNDQARIKQLNDDLGLSRETIGSLNKRTQQIQTELADAEQRAEAQEKVARLLRERVAQLDEELKDVRDRGGAAGKSAEAAPTAPKGITGTVTAVESDHASINIGSAKGIQQGMELVIYRDTAYVGNLRVLEVDIDQAAGIVTNKLIEPMAGDKVTTSLR